MMKTHLSLRTLLCWSVLICLAPVGLMAQEAEKTEAKKTEAKPAAEEKKPAAEEKKPAAEEKKPAAEEKKPAAEEKKPAAEEKKPAAEEKKPASEEPTLAMTEMVIGLDNPSGLAIQPKTGHIFIASHDGIHRFDPNQKPPLKCPLEVSDFPTRVYGKGPMYDTSALGVIFWDDTHLIVGEGARKDGEELVRVYKVGDKAPDSYQKEADDAMTTGPIPPGDESKMGEGNFYSLAKINDTVFVSSNGDDTKGWIVSFTIKDGKATELKPAIATKEKTQVDAPVPLVTSPDGKKLVVGQMGEVNVPGDSLLCIYDPESGELEKNMKTGLSDIAGLAYSPQTKKLYCTDFAWAEPENAGLFELTIEGDKVTPKKLAKLDKPTALVFDKDGNLYVTVIGNGKEGDKMTPGKLLMIKADQLK